MSRASQVRCLGGGVSRAHGRHRQRRQDGAIVAGTGPDRGGLERVVLWVQVSTAMELDDKGVVHLLDARTWRQRRQRLHELGGPPLP